MRKILLILGFLKVFSFSSLCASFDYDEEVDEKKFIAYVKKNSDPSSWMMQQIAKDLSLFDPQDFNTRNWPYSFSRGVYRFEIQNNKVQLIGDENYVEFRRETLLGALRYFAKTLGLPNSSILISLEDSEDSLTNKAPICCFAKSRHARSIAMPDFEALLGYGKSGKQAREGNNLYPWESKKNMMFWRGASTGGLFTRDNWTSFPRSRIVLLSRQYPQLINAYFTAIVQAEDSVGIIIKKMRYWGAPVPVTDSIQFKYLIDIDGNSCTYSRNYWILLSNSTLFKQQSDNIQWYYGLLQPWVHYIPVAYDLSDVLEKIQWAMKHDQEARMIAENGSRLAEEELCIEANLAYFYLLLSEISKLQNN